ncbi:MAG: hypothetical protein EPN17_11055 [Methylobacter sp.]|nr:MAG: hypothetical protein EPN17_11055 [Methylobacter sp.]
MTLFNKSLGALVLAALSLPANAVNVTVHNQGHYWVSFEVNGRHSDALSIGQSRTMENASGTIRIFSYAGYNSCVTTRVFTPEVDMTWDLQVGKNDVEIFFQGNEFNPRLKLNGFDPVNYFSWSINLNDEYSFAPHGTYKKTCEWVKNSFP